MYLISIIMPIYNAEEYLSRAINSIINQSIGFENIELILVDDFSNDSSRDIIEQFSKKYSNIVTFFSETNHGFPGYGRNVGLKNASAEYIMFIDNDDEYKEDLCETLYNAIEKEKCDIVSSNYKMIVKDSLIIYDDVFSRANMNVEYEDNDIKLINLDKFLNVTDPIIWTKIFKKSIILNNEITFVEDRLNEDGMFLFNYYLYAKSLIILNYSGYIYHKHGDNLSFVSSKTTLAFLYSYYDILDFIEDKYSNIDKNEVFRSHIEHTLYSIIVTSNQRCIIEKLYEFENHIEFNSYLDNTWLNFCNRLLLKRKFSILLVLFKIMRQYINFLNFLRKNIKPLFNKQEL